MNEIEEKNLRNLLELDASPIMLDDKLISLVTNKFFGSPNCPGQASPQLIGIGGGPGAGKSFLYDYLKTNAQLPNDAVVHDPDLVMQSIPDYIEDAKQNPIEAFKKWELPARQLANEILLKAVLARYNIIYIRTFALAESLSFVQKAKSLGYRFDFHLITCELSIAIERARKREQDSKRHLPTKILIHRHQAVLNFLPEIINVADHYFRYDNNEDGQPPICVAS